jgi:deoxyribonucleoside regulator
MTLATAPARGSADQRLLVRVARMYYGMNLTQEQIGNSLGLSRFRVGRLLDRAVRESIVRIEIVHPVARLIDLEDALVARYGLRAAVVADVDGSAPMTTDADNAGDRVAREAVATAAAEYLAAERPTGAIGVSWGRTMLELAGRLEPGWTIATEVVQLNGATSRSSTPTRVNEIVDRFAGTAGAGIRLMPAPAIVGSAALRLALEADPSVGDTLEAARRAPFAVFSLGIPTARSVLVESGFVGDADRARLTDAGAVGDVLGRFLAADGTIALPDLDDRTVGLPLADMAAKTHAVGLAAGLERGPIALAAIRAGCVNVLVTDEATAQWLVRHD